MNLTDFSISPGVWAGFVAAAIGMGLLFIFLKSFSGGRMMRVPDGISPDKYYRDWKAGALGKKISRGMVFTGIAALALLVGGCSGIIAGVAS